MNSSKEVNLSISHGFFAAPAHWLLLGRARVRGVRGLQAAAMAAPGGGDPLPPPSVELAAFRRLVASRGKRKITSSVPKFIKKLEEISEIALPKTTSVKIALALSERGLVGQFMGLWTSAKTTDD